MILTTAYLPPVAWFALLARDMTLSPDRVSPSVAFLEACEAYQKQSYRNRSLILAGDGVQMLQVPVVHGSWAAGGSAGSVTEPGSGEVTSVSGGIRSLRIDWSTPWLVRTQRALDAAYYRAAYFEHYRDGLYAVMDSRPTLLWDWNLSLIRYLLEQTGISCDLRETESFVPPGDEAIPDDYRYAIHPKRPCSVLQELGLDRPYHQVFSDRFGFTPGLSVVDLLFNEGPDAILWLKRL